MIGLAFLLAAVVGLSLGLLGGGGSILTVPIFVYVLGFDAKEAIAMSLPVVGAASVFGAIGHWRAGNVNVRAAALFGTFAMAASYAGARLAVFFSAALQLFLFAIVMLLAAAFMFRSTSASRGVGPSDASAGTSHRMIALAAVGVGVLTGLLGVGGGFLIVPALVVLGDIPMKEAVGTSLLVIAMNSLAGFAGHVGQVEMRWTFITGFTLVATLGILAGTRLVRHVSQTALKRVFAVALVAMGGFILYQNRQLIMAE